MKDFSKVGEAGCSQCGLMGCDCHERDIARAFHGLCKKCRASPCICNKPKASEDVCPVCHRAMSSCLCVSHAPYFPARDDFVARPPVVERPYSEHHIDKLVNEALNHYYNRDPEGLARWLRRELR